MDPVKIQQLKHSLKDKAQSVREYKWLTLTINYQNSYKTGKDCYQSPIPVKCLL